MPFFPNSSNKQFKLAFATQIGSDWRSHFTFTGLLFNLPVDGMLHYGNVRIVIPVLFLKSKQKEQFKEDKTSELIWKIEFSNFYGIFRR